MKSSLSSHQEIEKEMKKATFEVMKEKIDNSLSKKQLSEFIDTEKVTDEVTNKVLNAVSKNIKEAINDTFR
jgi:preprotein translocase subunit SecA